MEIDFDTWNNAVYSIKDVDKLLLAYRLGSDFIHRIENFREKLSEIEDRHIKEMAIYSRHFFENGQPFKILQQHKDIPSISKLLNMCEHSTLAIESWTGR